MSVVTGITGVLVIGSTGLFTGILDEWERTIEEAVDIENAAQGDGWDTSVHVRNRWMFRSNYQLPLVSYTSMGSLVGAVNTVSGKIATADSAPFFAGSGRGRRDNLRSGTEATVKGELEMKGLGAPTTV